MTNKQQVRTPFNNLSFAVIYILILYILPNFTNSQTLSILQPQQLTSSLNKTTLKLHSSPIGFKPITGTLHGKIILAEPFSACADIQAIQNQQNQDIFVMVNDQGCMESIKARNVAGSGAYIGIFKRNINNTLNDREIDAVHIPILEMQTKQFDIISSYIRNNPNLSISALADFSHSSSPAKKINLQLWFSPTQIQAYSYILQLQNFILNQASLIQFQPHYILHSHLSSSFGKSAQYVGCLSSGRFCAPQLEFQGTLQGEKIVSQSLRQKIIADKDIKKWFEYIKYYKIQCLGKQKQNLWKEQNSIICSQGVMMTAGIDTKQIFSQYFSSFLGARPQIDSNTYLEQQRQLYLQQKITSYPILLLNSKSSSLDNTPQSIKIRICKMIHPDPTKQSEQCQQITNKKLFSSGQFMIILAILINVLVCLMIICKYGIKKRMQGQIQNQVESTLGQYYRYMNQMEGEDIDISIGNNYNREKKDNSNEIEYQIHPQKQNTNKNNGKVQKQNNNDKTIQLQSFEN